MYFVPSKNWMNEAVKAIKEYGGTHGIDPMTGSGWLPYFLEKEYKLPVIAIDNRSRWEGLRVKKCPYITIHCDDAITGIANNPEANFMILSWPTLPSHTKGRDVALEILQAWNAKGSILYIGEWYGQTTGGDDFLEYLNANYTLKRISGYKPRHESVHDAAYFCTPKPPMT